MQVKCDREGCGHKWDYTGKSRFKATCPMCRKIVNLVPSDATPDAEARE
jgi:ribosomal protein S27E